VLGRVGELDDAALEDLEVPRDRERRARVAVERAPHPRDRVRALALRDHGAEDDPLDVARVEGEPRVEVLLRVAVLREEEAEAAAEDERARPGRAGREL